MQAGKDGRRSQEVCPTLASRFSFLQRAATGMNDSCKGVGISSSAVPDALPSDACTGGIFIISAPHVDSVLPSGLKAKPVTPILRASEFANSRPGETYSSRIV